MNFRAALLAATLAVSPAIAETEIPNTNRYAGMMYRINQVVDVIALKDLIIPNLPRWQESSARKRPRTPDLGAALNSAHNRAAIE